MDNTPAEKKNRLGLSLYLNLGKAIVFTAAAFFLIYQVNAFQRQQALLEAESKSRIILDRNLAIHTYFSHHLKPKVFALTDAYRPDNYFDSTWMSSTFAVREIDKIVHTRGGEEYYYKECAVNARSPENEADEFEKAFIDELQADPTLQYRSLVRQLEGGYYYVTLRRGEVLEESCLRCHSTPEKAPKGLVDAYGRQRSFNRQVGEVVSAISIRVPLSSAYARADALSRQLALILVGTFFIVFGLQYLLYRYLIIKPIKSLRDQAELISANDAALGEEIPLPVSRELGNLASSFNLMSRKLRRQMDTLEEQVEERTVELQRSNDQLQNALDEIKVLEGILPVCCYCKNIRDDTDTEQGKGSWMKMEEFLHRKTGAGVSHGCCPDCFKKHIDD